MPLKKFFTKNKLEVGCDEAGRGCLAGPVVAAAVLFEMGYENNALNDSKKLTASKRLELAEMIKSDAKAYGIGIVNHIEIDEINILNASILAMHRALEQITDSFDSILVDGNRFKPYREIEYHCMVKGDARFMSIAAASILAKTHRDDIMIQYGQEFPEYMWVKNKGYPTVEHREAISRVGISPYHRKSFKLLPEQLTLF